MCGNGGHLCPKVTHVFKNCLFHQCVNDMLCQIPGGSCPRGNAAKEPLAITLAFCYILLAIIYITFESKIGKAPHFAHPAFPEMENNHGK